MKAKERRGISLIVLVITIIVIIILAAAVILTLGNNNPIESANQAVFKNDLSEFQSGLTLSISDDVLAKNGNRPNKFNASTLAEMQSYIKNFKADYEGKLEIVEDQLVYAGEDGLEKDWANEVGIPDKDESTTHQNPPIPTGFYHVGGAVGEGFVISDVAGDDMQNSKGGNQFVWVQVDDKGTEFADGPYTAEENGKVHYKKWCTNGASYANTTDDSLPNGVDNELTQIKKNGGFYIGRYEATFDYNNGNIRAASKKSTNKAVTDWSTSRDAVHNGYLWNFITYDDAKKYSVEMASKHNYASSIKTGLVTGKQWDTVMRWIELSGKSVTDSRTWGNYNNSEAPANVSGHGSLQISGYSEEWKAKNIYDTSGNMWEFTNEIYDTGIGHISRGGYYDSLGSDNPASFRNSNTTGSGGNRGFRLCIYM